MALQGLHGRSNRPHTPHQLLQQRRERQRLIEHHVVVGVDELKGLGALRRQLDGMRHVLGRHQLSAASMTTVQITLPDQLAQEAQPAVLLAPERLDEWLRDQLDRQRVDELFSAIDRMANIDAPVVMSPEDVAQEIATMRAERRTKNAS